MTGSEIRKLRKAVGATGTDLAREMRASAPHLCNVENGKRAVTRKLEARVKAAAVRIAEKRLARVKRLVEGLDAAEAARLQMRMEIGGGSG